MDLPTKVWLANEIRIWGTAVTALFGVITFLAMWNHCRWQTEFATQKEDAAKIVQQESNQKIAAAQTDAAKANERAAELTNEAAQARLETEKLKRQLAWRLSEAQFDTIVRGLIGLNLKDSLSGIANDPKSMLFANDIQRAMRAAGFPTDVQSSVLFATCTPLFQRRGGSACPCPEIDACGPNCSSRCSTTARDAGAVHRTRQCGRGTPCGSNRSGAPHSHSARVSVEISDGREYPEIEDGG